LARSADHEGFNFATSSFPSLPRPLGPAICCQTLSPVCFAFLIDMWSIVRDTRVTLSLYSPLNVRDPRFVPV